MAEYILGCWIESWDSTKRLSHTASSGLYRFLLGVEADLNSWSVFPSNVLLHFVREEVGPEGDSVHSEVAGEIRQSNLKTFPCCHDR